MVYRGCLIGSCLGVTLETEEVKTTDEGLGPIQGMADRKLPERPYTVDAVNNDGVG